jgi:hypothetical protein
VRHPACGCNIGWTIDAQAYCTTPLCLASYGTHENRTVQGTF